MSVSKISDEKKILNFSEYNSEYINIQKDRLVLFTINYLVEKNIEPTFDKIVVAVFKLFPKKFSLIGFPEYPDGKNIHDCLFHLFYKTKRWISGNAKSGYKITIKGNFYLDETKKILDGKIELKKKYATIPERKEITFIDKLKETEAYKKYVLNKKEEITIDDIMGLVRVRRPSEKLIKEHLEKYYDYAKRINDPLTLEFLESINDIFLREENGKRNKKRTR